MSTSHAGDIPGRFLLCPSSPSMCCLWQLAHRHPGPAEPFVWATAEERDHLVCALPVGVTTAASAQVLGLGKWVGGTWCGGREQAGPFQAFMFGLGCSFIIQKKKIVVSTYSLLAWHCAWHQMEGKPWSSRCFLRGHGRGYRTCPERGRPGAQGALRQ